MTSAYLNLLALLQEQGPVPLRHHQGGWDYWHNGTWTSDRGLGRRFHYLSDLAGYVPTGETWDKVRRDLTTTHGQQYILRAWARPLHHDPDAPEPGDRHPWRDVEDKRGLPDSPEPPPAVRTPLDLLTHLQERGPVPLRNTPAGWQHQDQGVWGDDRGVGRRFMYLEGLKDLVPAGEEWGKVRRALSTTRGQQAVLTAWAGPLYRPPTPPLPGDRVDLLVPILRRLARWSLGDVCVSWWDEVEDVLGLPRGALDARPPS
jgi:hypothetical protein